MGSKTVALERSTYERLKAARRPGESFTDVVNRLLEGREPSFLDFVGLIPKEDAEALARTVAEMRRQDVEIEMEKLRAPSGGRLRGRGR